MSPAKKRPPPVLSAARLPAGTILRLLIFAVLAIGGAAWALVRHRTVVLPPMEVPLPRPAPTYDPDAGELPVPEVLE